MILLTHRRFFPASLSALSLAAVALALPADALANDAALITIRNGKEKKQVAIELYEAEAPETVANFRKLARSGFYKGTAFHRAFPHTMVQVGDPLSKKKDRSKVGIGGPGYTVQAEIRRKHVKGAVATARLPDRINPSRMSNGSQFYVCLKPIPTLDGQYTVFGGVLWGLDVLDGISTQAVDSNDYPVQRITIEKIKILSKAELPQPPAPPVPPGAAPAPATKAKPGEKPAAGAAASTATKPKRPWYRWVWPW